MKSLDGTGPTAGTLLANVALVTAYLTLNCTLNLLNKWSLGIYGESSFFSHYVIHHRNALCKYIPGMILVYFVPDRGRPLALWANQAAFRTHLTTSHATSSKYVFMCCVQIQVIWNSEVSPYAYCMVVLTRLHTHLLAGFTFPIFMTVAHMVFSLVVLLPVMMLGPFRALHMATLAKQWKGLLCIGVFMAMNIGLNNLSLVDISLSLNQVIRCGLACSLLPGFYFANSWVHGCIA
jgi:hypothetical protein